MINILLYILGAIAVIAAGIYFFMRREPSTQSAADIARAQTQQDPTPEPQGGTSAGRNILGSRATNPRGNTNRNH